MRVYKHLGMQHTVHRIGHKQPAKKQNLCDQKEPNAKFPGIKLLLHRLKVMSQVGIMTMVMAPMMVALFFNLLCFCGRHLSDTKSWKALLRPRRVL